MANTYEQEVELQEMFEKRASLFDKMSSSVRGMTGMFQQIAKAMEKLSNEDNINYYKEQNTLLAEAEERLKAYGDTSEEAFDKVEDGLSTSQKLMKTMQNDLERIGKKSMVWATMASSLEGFVKGLKFTTNAMGSMWNITKNVAASLGHFATSVISFPFKLLSGLMNLAQQSGGDNSLRQALEDIRKEFGDLRTGASAAIIDIARSLRGPLAETGLNARRIFGNLAEALKFIQEYAHNMGPLFNIVSRQLTASADAAQRFGAYIKGLGLQDLPEAQKAIARMSVTSGKDINELGREITSFAYQMGEAFGINGKEISRDVGKMMADFDNFGNLSIQTLTNVSIYARKLGVEIEKLKGVVTSFDDFEKAAEGAAQLSQAFGLNIDAFQMIQEQDPAARIEQLRKAFFAAGRSVENMTRQERALLAEQTGLDQETLSLVFAQKNASTSYGDIQKQSEATRKKQLSQAEAMEKLSNSIERMVKSGASLQGGFFKIFLDGFTAGIMRSRDFRGLMRDLRQDMRIVFREGRQVGRMFVEAFPGVRDMLGGLRDIFNPTEWRRRMSGVSEIFKRFFNDLGNPNTRSTAFGNFVTNIREHFSDLFNPQSAGGQRFLDGVKRFFAAFGVILAGGLRFAIQSVTRGLVMLTDFIRDPSAAMARLRAAGSAGAGASGFVMQNLIVPIIDAFRELGPQLWTAFSNLAKLVWDKIKENVFPKVMEWLPNILRVMFAPAAISGAMNLAGSGFSMLFARLFGSVLTNILSRSVQQGGRQVAGAAGSLIENATESLGRVAETAPRGSNAARAVSGAASVIPSVSEAAEASQGTAITPASGAKMAMIAGVILVGVIAVVGAIIALAYIIKNTSLTAGDIALSVGTLAGATLIMGAITLLAMEVTAAAPVAAGAPALIPVIAALGALAGAMALGMTGLAILLRRVHLTTSDVGLAIAVMGGAALVIAEVIAGAILLAGAGIATIALPAIGAGIVAAGLFAEGLVTATDNIIKSASNLDAGAITLTAAKIGTTLLIFGGLLALGAGLAAAGIAGAVALPAIAVGLAGVEHFADKLVEVTSSVVSKIQTMPDPLSIRDKIEVVIRITEAIGNFIGSVGNVVGGTSIAAALLGRSTIESQINKMQQFVTGIATTIPNMVEKLVEATNKVTGDQAAIQRATSVSQIIGSIGQFVGSILNVSQSLTDLDNPNATITALGQFFQSIKNRIVELMGAVSGIITGIIAQAGTLDPAKAGNISAISGAFTTILTSLSNLFTTVLRSNAVREILGNTTVQTQFRALGGFFTTIIGALSSGESNFFSSIGNLVTRIVESANLDPAKAASLYNISRILQPMFGGIQTIMGVLGTIGPDILRGGATEVQAKINGLKDVLGAISTGFAEAIGSMIPKLISGLDTIPANQAGLLARKVETLSQVLEATRTITRIAEGAGVFTGGLKNFFSNIAPLMDDTIISNVQAVKQDTIGKINEVITSYATLVGMVNDDLNRISRSSNNITVNLQRARDRLGLSGRQRSQLTVGSVTVNINVNVIMDVDDIETAIATRPNGSTFAITATPGSGRLTGENYDRNAVVTTSGG